MIATLLVPVGDAKVSGSALNAAFLLAAPFGAHVIGLHVRGDPAAAVPLVGEGMSGAMVEEMIALAERQSNTRATAARALFEAARDRHGAPLVAAPPAAGLSAEWIEITGREEETVALRGRLADLVVMARPESETDAPTLMTLNAALMESGRPLLLAPPAPVAAIGTRVAIAWNGSAEAGRAVASALPILARADAVTLLSIGEDHRIASVPAGDLAASLAWHGVIAACRTLAAPAAQTGEALLAACGELDADLLVMGAYTHSRLRQMIFGGVTRHVLNHAEVACLLSH